MSTATAQSAHTARKPLGYKSHAWPWLLSLAALAAAGMAQAQSRAEQRVLRVPAVQSWSAPYALYRDGALVAGINHDIVQALAEHLGMSLQTLVLPRTRVDAAVAAGELDLRCHLSPDWVRSPEAYSWSPPLFELATVLAGHESAVPVSNLDQLHRGQTVGTVLGFVYPGLEERFSDGRLRRDDTFAVDRNLQKLKLIRSPYAVADTREIAWHLRQDPGHQFATWRLPITRTDYRCAVPRNGRIEATLLLAGFERLLASGQIDRIVRNYSPPQPVLVMAANSAVQQLSRQQISALFLGEMLELPGGGRAVLGSLGGALRQEFFSQVLDKDAAQLKAIWSRMTFSGRGRAPREFSTAAALRAWLINTPNALAFLDSSSLDPSLKIVYTPQPAAAAGP
ncbi:transporter substrate-binding domain-containing protein [Paucibacter sp. DJ1R-11]|uniref:substrate-binding periplasmic protein n=1 Tax=Paucibacter sp. DJ1R-11 TaxID=2893556 RepID=UPI0021E362F9|nr:transporter substrate-binding domain-containing protein [Paucibacter sp. DJ1R-11]MCV2365266.1 transporter substrate-binding domain-containing protein [Paucibacter sp. DJ1R-11]